MIYKTKDILRMERLKRGWRQEDVAAMLNMARASYAKYETGKNIPTTENIIKLSEIYNISTDYLLKGMDFTTAMKRSIQQGDEWSEEILEEFENKRARKKRKKTEQHA